MKKRSDVFIFLHVLKFGYNIVLTIDNQDFNSEAF